MARYSDVVGLPRRLPLATEAANRDDTPNKDAKLVNCYIEKQPDGGYTVYKRPGLSVAESLSRPSAETGRGVYNWNGDVYAVFNGTLYKNGSSLGSVANSGMYHFSSDLLTQDLVLKNSTNAYTCDGTTVTAISDADYPATTVPGIGYLDGTTYVMTPTAEIRGSDLDDPTAWDPLNTITAQIEPDAGVAVAKQLVYIIAIKQWTTEVFYDAQSPTGSPLGTVQGAKVPFGCVNGESVQSIDDVLIWVSRTRSAQAQVVQLAGLKAELVSTPAIERLVDHTSFTTMYSWLYKNEGHTFYIFTNTAANITLAYDMRERKWAQWTDSSGNYFPMCAASYDSQQRRLFQHISNGKIYYADSTYYSDAGAKIPVRILTPNIDFGLDLTKQLKRMFILADVQAGSILRMRFNDQDYTASTWSPWWDFDLSYTRPMATDLGSFTRRAFEFYHEANTPLRIRDIGLQLDLGTL